MNKKRIKAQTQSWLNCFIIKYNICPFARKAHLEKKIHYAVIDSNKTYECLNAVFTECQRLDSLSEIETTLIIYPNHLTEFEQYLDFIEMAEALLLEYNYEGIYQIASFHPQYCFQGEKPEDPANYTNRSPYPMLHLIRESSLEQALQSYSHPEKIPEINSQLLRTMGLKKIESMLNKINNNEKNL